MNKSKNSNNALIWVADKIKGNDSFGVAINTRYKTKIGGWVSLIITIFMVYTAYSYLRSVVERSNITHNKSVEKL